MRFGVWQVEKEAVILVTFDKIQRSICEQLFGVAGDRYLFSAKPELFGVFLVGGVSVGEAEEFVEAKVHRMAICGPAGSGFPVVPLAEQTGGVSAQLQSTGDCHL